jgi:Fe-S cluster assembly protein SufD
MSTAVDFLEAIREQAAQRFDQLGWPNVRQEEWKYTNLGPLSSVEWHDGGIEPRDIGRATLPLAALELIFVNGMFVSRRGELPKGVKVLRLADAIQSETFERHFAKYADYENHPLTALNTAKARDGAFIEIEGGTVVDGFIHLLFAGSGDGVWSHPRNLIVAGRNAQVTIVETYAGSGRYFTNAVTEIVAGDGAVVDHYKVECESREAFHVGTVQIHQERASTVIARSVAIGGAIVRNETNAVLAGEGASLTLDGLFTPAGKQHIDNHTVVDHQKPHCESIELYKGILDDEARGIFDGRIVVRPGAVKTSSRQTNKNLLLSETAIVDSKPTLEILNDDVKCNHGSTIGQIDEEAMFYLRSRGLGADDARALLVLAFAGEIIDRMNVEPVREQIRRTMRHDS